jgi:hypothetical protein
MDFVMETFVERKKKTGKKLLQQLWKMHVAQVANAPVLLL